MAPSCVCRRNLLWTFVRNVAQAHVPSAPTTRALWQESRRPIHIYTGRTRLSALTTSSCRQMHTDTTESNATAPQGLSTNTTVEPNDLPSESHPVEETKRPKKARWRDKDPEEVKMMKERSEKRKAQSLSQRRESAPARRPEVAIDNVKAGVTRFKAMLQIQNEKLAAREGKMSKSMEEDAEKEGVFGSKEKEQLRNEEMPMWAIQKEALKEKFPEGWQPRKRLSPDAMAGIRELHKHFPELYTTAALARKFEVSPEAIRRILKSKWTANAEEEEDRQARWFRRGQAVWTRWAELGLKPPKKWRDEGIQRVPRVTKERIGPWSQEEKEAWEGEKVDPETARRLKVQSRISKNLL